MEFNLCTFAFTMFLFYCPDGIVLIRQLVGTRHLIGPMFIFYLHYTLDGNTDRCACSWDKCLLIRIWNVSRLDGNSASDCYKDSGLLSRILPFTLRNSYNLLKYWNFNWTKTCHWGNTFKVYTMVHLNLLTVQQFNSNSIQLCVWSPLTTFKLKHAGVHLKFNCDTCS